MTFSIVARDPKTGAFGAATATGGPCVGALVPHVAPGIGAIATQGDTNPFYGIEGLNHLRDGMAAEDLVRAITARDPGNDRRQLIAIGPTGPAGIFSGSAVTPASGAFAEQDFAVAGNMLANDDVLSAMISAFARVEGDLAQRLLAAMTAGQAAGGDQRGTQSAALIVYSSHPYADFNCRVDLSETPLTDLAAVLAASRSGDYAEFMAQRPRQAIDLR